MRLNNVSVEALEAAVRAAQANSATARRVNRVEGSWNLVEGQPQFVAVLGFDKGELLVEADQPPPQGGGGTRPGPVQYCLFGLASCFAATYASNAAMMGVQLSRLRVAAEADVNFSRTFGLSDEPIIEGVRITIDVESDAPEEELQRLEELAAQRCPAVFCMTNQVPLKTTLRRNAGSAGVAAIARWLAEDHPDADREALAAQFRSILEAVLPSLARRASAALAAGAGTPEEVWLAIKHEAEEDFAQAMTSVGRGPAVFAASKFMNNQGFGLAITQEAMARAALMEAR